MTRKEQKEVKKSQIIQATLDLFVERGYYGTKTSQISRRAGISEGLLFHYFPTKEILLEELINIGLEGMRTPMQINAKNGLDFFYQFTTMLFSQAEKKPSIAQMFVFMGHVVLAEDIPERLRELASSVDTVSYCQWWVESGQQDGEYPERKCDVNFKYVLVFYSWNNGTVCLTPGNSVTRSELGSRYAAK